MPRCEDYPCCGHEAGCCPSFDHHGKQENMICICGAKLPVTNKSSLCNTCLRDMDDFDSFSEGELDEDRF